MGPGTLGGTQDRTQVVGVGYLVAHHQQRRLALGGGGLQDLLHRGVFPHGRQSDDPLVGMGAAHGVQLPPVGIHHHDARGAGLGGDVSQRLVRLALGDVDLVDGRLRPQGLDDRVAALDDAVRLGVGQRPSVLGVLYLSHGAYLAIHIIVISIPHPFVNIKAHS